MKFTTLLPPAAAHSNGGRRSGLLLDADEPAHARFRVSAATFTAADEPVLRVCVRANAWAFFGIDGAGVLRASAWGASGREAEERWEQLMDSFGLCPRAEVRTMLPPKAAHGGPRRSSLLLDADDPDSAGNQVSAKVLSPQESDLLQIRIWIRGHGWTQLLLDELLGLVSFAAAETEKAAWKAAQAGARVRGYSV
jgi:hypothetical protein